MLMLASRDLIGLRPRLARPDGYAADAGRAFRIGVDGAPRVAGFVERRRRSAVIDAEAVA